MRTLKTFQGTHILGASRGLLCDSSAVLLSDEIEAIYRTHCVVIFGIAQLSCLLTVSFNVSERRMYSKNSSFWKYKVGLYAYAVYFQKLVSLVYIFVADSMGLSSFKFVQSAPKHVSFLHQSAFWPFKVVQGHPRSMILVLIESACTTFY